MVTDWQHLQQEDRELKIIDYINECCDDPEKLLNDMDDYEIRKMAYRWVEIWKTLNSSEGYNPALAMRKTDRDWETSISFSNFSGSSQHSLM